MGRLAREDAWEEGKTVHWGFVKISSGRNRTRFYEVTLVPVLKIGGVTYSTEAEWPQHRPGSHIMVGIKSVTGVTSGWILAIFEGKAKSFLVDEMAGMCGVKEKGDAAGKCRRRSVIDTPGCLSELPGGHAEESGGTLNSEWGL